MEVRYYEEFYRKSVEPWNYSFRGAELYRHRKIPEVLAQLKPKFARVLDIGCSLGQLTRNLGGISDSLYAMDVSAIAIEAARKNCRHLSNHFLVGGLPRLPFLNNSFDLVIASDAIHEFVPKENRMGALLEIYSILREGGICLFSDYLKPADNRNFLVLIKSSGFKIIKMVPLYDRLWYNFESWFKAIRHWSWVRKILSSLWIVRVLTLTGRILEEFGSRHVLILAQKGEKIDRA